MTAPCRVLKPDHYDPPLNVVGTRVTVLATNEVAQSYGFTIQEGEEGTGPPPHSHDWDEAFFVLQGEINFLCDGATHVCGAGAFVHVPRGTVHAFSYGRGGGRMLEVTGPGARAAQMFMALDREMPPGPPDVPKAVEVLERHGVRVAV